ncbi:MULTISPECIES: tail protein X [unclassified Ensifer]|uniref:tail protein X n=1 Tax=unclassified Ensifer TaxID=2633371 RepID=UPI0008135E40|nr:MULTISPECIES: tail protein X [unclassified Ensifer]OCP17423.1 hypothetical protein BC361_08170 [Ensifer sp. LC54]OCP28671.1 hypothetical protein BC363_02185 [Ensifer sp. LC384]
MSSYSVPFGGERLDRIAKAVLRSERDGAVEALLAVNPGLAEKIVDGFVPAGTIIRIPEAISTEPSPKTVLSWE